MEDGQWPRTDRSGRPGIIRRLQSRRCVKPLVASSWSLAEGFTDTAQSYRNEAEAGVAIRESGLSRGDIFITTKFSGTDGLDIPTSIKNSLKNVRLGLEPVARGALIPSFFD